MKKIAGFITGGVLIMVPILGFIGKSSPIITTAALRVGTINQAYGQTLTATGGRAPYVWSAMPLPPGFSIGNGQITGSTFAPFTEVVTITVRDRNNKTAMVQLPLAVCYPIIVTPLSAAVPVNGTQQFQAWGGADSLNPPVCAGQAPVSF